MNKKLVLDSTRETHSLYVKERERERVLAPTECPADLVRRRLEQAGYDVADGLQTLGSDEIGFLIKFIYKSNLLGGAGQEDFKVENFEYIDLTGRSLKTIPIILHSHAQTIISLNLSRNPMLEIPLDFIQSCGTLRELRLSNMAMKKVPQSVRHSISLNRLDVSCNRIADLDDSGLDRIPLLSNLKAQNNRIDKLPSFFPQMHSLRFLNISNNKFQTFPSVIPEMTNLVDLDISFNEIESLPDSIGRLKHLERFLIVGNKISVLPATCEGLTRLEMLDCRRNNISDLSLVCKLPCLQSLWADHNTVHALSLVVGPRLQKLDASFNDITQLIVHPSAASLNLSSITTLNISYAKLSSLDGIAFAHLTSLRNLRLEHNSFRSIPDTLGALLELEHLSCSDNQLDALPDSIGELQKLKMLDAHNNSLTELPASMWQCCSLETLNVTSNLLKHWHDPPSPVVSSDALELLVAQSDNQRKLSTAGSIASTINRVLPPLAHSLQNLYLGENQLTEDVLHPLTVLRELRVLNLSFNEIQDLPPSFFRNYSFLVEIYLSGNKLSTIPTEDMHRLTNLTVMFLNGNKLQVLPHEFSKLTSLTVLDVGSNLLKYNINNWEFDWNWNFNKNLKYLNLSGNKRLKIQPDNSHRMSMYPQHQQIQSMQRKVLADFSELTQLRVLGLMDVTVTSSGIPEDTEDRRVRTSLSEVNGMAYGIADTLGKKGDLGMLDVVLPEFRNKRDECIFAMFGRFDAVPMNNRVSKYLCENFSKVFTTQLERLNGNENAGDALRRTFLLLNKSMHAFLTVSANLSRKLSTASASTATASVFPTDLTLLRNGASGIVVYFEGKTIHVANAGDALAVISRQGTAHLVSKKHEPFDRDETKRIRAAEGWVSPKGLVNEDAEVSRSFGYYHLLPAVNPRPDVFRWELSELDEFVIIANRGLWDYVSYRTAVDIARSEKDDPMIAAQKLRDFAMSYGADGSTMIMVVSVAGLFEEKVSRSRQATVGSINETEVYMARRPQKKTDDISDVALKRLPQEISAPVGHVALVFTDIRNSTILWETNAAMPTAMRIHNSLLRRQLRLCGGYEVKTEGDAFMCSFQSAMSAVLWCLEVQRDLLREPWPIEILSCAEGREVTDSHGRIIERGLSVRMGIHCGTPVCETDPITHRMDYFGPMVNRSARIESSAAGGQIMCSADVMREIKERVLSHHLDNELDPSGKSVIDSIRRIGLKTVDVGETRLKGLEIPEHLHLVYAEELIGRQEYREPDLRDLGPKDQRSLFTATQVRDIGLLCVRLETLATSRVLRPPARKGSTATTKDEAPSEESGVILHADPSSLLPSITDKATDEELLVVLESLSSRIENALTRMTVRSMGEQPRLLLQGIQRGDELDERTLLHVLSLLTSVLPSQLDSSS
ncbi:L domain-like protein [Schizopora paradoxa]|uniref:Adenylate cyclase n=1 Tax=Schizopora paradoxa TaxID=27342 RepID=A0A0H2SE92_9AGAM|nr:L domain-like protein [Schizopora paradoxa]